MLTKRYVSTAAEEVLYQPVTLNHGSVVLSDYMGGDPTIELAATCGLGRKIVDPDMTKLQLFRQLVARRIFEPFKFAQVQLVIQAPIDAALQFVYNPRCSVNEYSLRYSEALDSSFIPTLEDLTAEGLGPSHARFVIDCFKTERELAFAAYQFLIDPNVDLTRELARTVLGSDQDTRFSWKMDLYSLSEFVKAQRAHDNQRYKEFVDAVEAMAMRIAPLAWKALMCSRIRKEKLLYPLNSDIVNPDFNFSFEPTETSRPIAEGLEERLLAPTRFLGHGLFFPFDYMGNDKSIADAARASYGKGTKSVSEDHALIRHLFRNAHTSPFEMPELAFMTRVPFFSDPRQLGRHRTLDFTPFMGRYAISKCRFYIPDETELKAQSKKDKQGRGLYLEPETRRTVQQTFSDAFARQEHLIVPDYLSRILIGVGHYTKLSRTGDLRNLLHMFSLRLDPHAQFEVRKEAEAIAEAVRSQCPTAYQAFEDYQMNAVRFSAQELEILRGLVEPHDTPDRLIINAARAAAGEKMPNKTERNEFIKKLKERLGLIDIA